MNQKVTQKEIYEGLLNEKEPNTSAICFIRDITNLETNLSDANVARFIDVKTDSDGKVIVDKEAKSLLDELKNKKVPSKLNAKTNIFQFQVEWRNNGIDSECIQSYLDSFGDVFFVQIKRLVDEAMFREQQKEKLVHRVYLKLGVIDDEVDLSESFSGQSVRNEMLEEFKDLMLELGLHANEYNVTISKFFGRDDLMIKVNKN